MLSEINLGGREILYVWLEQYSSSLQTSLLFANFLYFVSGALCVRATAVDVLINDFVTVLREKK